MKITRGGVDLAKNLFRVHAADCSDRAMWMRQLKRANWLKAVAERLELMRLDERIKELKHSNGRLLKRNFLTLDCSQRQEC